MSLDFTPCPASAAVHRRVLGYARYEFGLLARNGEQLLLTIVIPVALLFGLATFGERIGVARPQVTASVIAVAVIASAFTSLAIATSFERRSASLQLFATTPLTAIDVLAGKALTIAATETLQLVIILVIAAFLGLGPFAVLPMLIVLILGTLCFASLGFFIAGTLRAEAVLAVANGLFLFFLVACGLTVPLTAFPPLWSAVMQYTPATALLTALNGAIGGAFLIMPMCVIVAWGILAAVLARFTFRWDS